MIPKTCSRCKKEKSIIEFYLHQGKLSSKCKECHKQAQREYRERQPEFKEARRRRYIKESLKTGMRYRVGLKYVFNSSIGNFKNCTLCKTHQPLENFGRDIRSNDGKRITCKRCDSKKRKARHIPSKRIVKTLEERRADARIGMRLHAYLQGNGCCLYCGETNPFTLNNHHIYGRKTSDFTITLCENHHAPFTRGLQFLLADWTAPTD